MIVYYGATFERRLSIVLDLADKSKKSAFIALVEPMFNRLDQEWKTEQPEIIDSVALVHSLDAIEIVPVEERIRISKKLLR